MPTKPEVTLEVIPYKGFLIVRRKDGIDIVDESSGRWFNMNGGTVKAAKWTISVWTRISSSFQDR